MFNQKNVHYLEKPIRIFNYSKYINYKTCTNNFNFLNLLLFNTINNTGIAFNKSKIKEVKPGAV